MNAPGRRGACPRLAAPIQTGDGLLARLIPSGQTIGFEALTVLCHAAERYGNGVVEMTSRGSIQIRGLSTATAPRFAAAVDPFGIDCGDAIPVMTHPLSGLEAAEVLDVTELVGVLRKKLAEAPFLGRLSAKLSVIVDGGGTVHLDNVAADIRLRAAENGLFDLSLAGDSVTATPLGTIAASDVPECTMRLLKRLARDAPHARMRTMIGAERRMSIADVVSDLILARRPLELRAPTQPIGVHLLRDSLVAVGIGVPFGHSLAQNFLDLAEAASREGASGVRTAPGRVLLMIGLQRERARHLLAQAASLEFVVDPGDARRQVVACPGSPVCASGQIPARALALTVAQAASAYLDSGNIIHVSGCSKGCAHPSPSAVTIVGSNGMCDIRVDSGLCGTVTVGELPLRISSFLRSWKAKGA